MQPILEIHPRNSLEKGEAFLQYSTKKIMRKRLVVSVGLLCALMIYVHGAQTYTLEDLYQMADTESQLIRVSESELAAANEGVKQAKNGLLPHLNIDIAGTYIGDAYLMTRGFSTSGTTDVIVAGLGPQSVQNGRQETPHWGNTFAFEASQVICAGGGIVAGIEMAKLGERIATLNVEKNRQEVRFMLTGFYLDLVKIENQIAVLDTHIALTKQVLELMEARLDAGTVLQNDLTRYELQLKQLELNRIRLQDAQSIIQFQLQTTLHHSEPILPDTLSMNAQYEKLEDSLAEAVWLSQANNNLNIQQAQAAGDLAEQQVKATRAASVPQIAAFIRDDLFGPYTSDLIPVNANVNAWCVGIGIHYDLGSLWHNHRAINKAKSEHNAAQQRIELAREGVQTQIHSAYVQFLTSLTEVDTERKQVELADENYQLIEKRYTNDLALLTDLLDASSTKLSADMALVNARIGLLYNYYQLKYATHSL